MSSLWYRLGSFWAGVFLYAWAFWTYYPWALREGAAGTVALYRRSLTGLPGQGFGSWKRKEGEMLLWNWCPRKLAGRLTLYLPYGLALSWSIASSSLSLTFLLVFQALSGNEYPATQPQGRCDQYPSQGMGSVFWNFSLSFIQESHSGPRIGYCGR